MLAFLRFGAVDYFCRGYVNGLCTYGRKPKFEPGRICRCFRKKAAIEEGIKGGRPSRCGLRSLEGIFKMCCYLIGDLLHAGNGGVTGQLINVLEAQGWDAEVVAGGEDALGDLFF